MARISAKDVEEVKARTNILDIVGDYVQLKPAGVGSYKGLCPFHDERSPSFHVRPQVGYYHCFGCGESGDVYSFLQAMDHVTFTEAVERLAARLSYPLSYEDGGRSDEGERSNRVRLIAANSEAERFFIAQLADPEAGVGRNFLGGRAFDPQAAAHFGVGYAPKSFDQLVNHLRQAGFNNEEIVASGLASQGDRGPYDRFRGRVVWPIRDVTGTTVGFGARRLFDDDNGPKYLNTPETPIFRKNQLLYGLDLAKRDISRKRQVVVVEGYTDVMACHLAGITTAVATCGTAFGVEHVRVLRRVIGDDSSAGQVIFTFDPDEAGQKAAQRSFAVLHEQRMNASTYVAVGPNGLDPCDLRLAQGDEALLRMIEAKRPLFEFVIRLIVARYDLNTVEGRGAALSETAPIVAEIDDIALRSGYVRELARLTGVERSDAERAVRAAGSVGSAGSARRVAAGAQHATVGLPPRMRGGGGTAGVELAGSGGTGDFVGMSAGGSVGGSGAASGTPSTPGSSGSAPVATAPSATLAQLGDDAMTRLEREALMSLLQYPQLVGYELACQAVQARFSNSTLAVVRDAMAVCLHSVDRPDWFDRVLQEVPQALRVLTEQLAVAPLPTKDASTVGAYVKGAVSSLLERDIVARKADLTSQLRRADPADTDGVNTLQRALLDLETRRRKLRGE